MGTEIDVFAALERVGSDDAGPKWVYVVGPIGSGKSTILRMLTADAVAARPVVALQLQPDNSHGYAGVGAREFFDEEEFTSHVEGLLCGSGAHPLLIIDGLMPESAERLGAWAQTSLPDVTSMQILCATLRDDVTMSSSWGGPASITIRVDERSIPGIATGTIQQHSETLPTYWELPLVTQLQVDH